MLGVVSKALEEGRKKIRAYHGSPHDFDRFSTDNIGTGEGAQAYGHGLYFAEREGTAQSYRDALSGKNASFDDGSYVPEWVLQAQKDGKLDIAKKDFEDRRVQIKDAMDSSTQPHLLQDQIDSNIKILQGIERLEAGDVPKVGRMYEVDIDASPDELLDYDLPLSEQPEIVMDAIRSTPDVRQRINMAIGSFGADKILGRDILEVFAQSKSGGMSSVPSDASEMLKSAGVKGVKYADAQTRFSPKGKTHNYVVFDDKLVEIARKYGVTLPVASAILAGTITPEQAQAGVVTPQKDGILKDTGDVALETVSGINRAVVDGLNFFTADQVNNVLNLMGSDKRMPNLYDAPYIKEATQGNYMDDGLPRDVVRTGSEFLSPL